MKYYRYKLISPTGNLASGFIKLPYRDIMSAITHLERDGSITIFVKHLGPLMAMVFKLAAFRMHRLVKRPQLAEMLNNIAIMLRSGLTLVTALEEIADSAEDPHVRADLKDMVTSIQGGITFSEAAGKYPYIFPATVLHLMRMGEETGQLDQMLAAASEHVQRIHGIISDTKQALLYPAIVFTVIGGGMLFWFYYVVPKIIGLFREMDVALPTITVWLLALSNFIRNHIFSMVLLGIIGVVLIHFLRRTNKTAKRTIDRMMLRTPIVKTLINSSSLAFITEYFSMLLNAGIDILQSFQIIIDSVSNEVYRDKLKKVQQGVSLGEGIADSFTKAELFPTFVTRMIAVGEKSGSMTEQLDHLSKVYRDKLKVLVASLGKLLEPLVLVLAGVFFAIILIALLLPVYDLVSQVSM
jgi:general secretion pathway protein F/type IV pilus assembly protein PilC